MFSATLRSLWNPPGNGNLEVLHRMTCLSLEPTRISTLILLEREFQFKLPPSSVFSSGYCGWVSPGTAVHPLTSSCPGSFSLGLIIKDVRAVKPCPVATGEWYFLLCCVLSLKLFARWQPYSSVSSTYTCSLSDMGRLVPKVAAKKIGFLTGCCAAAF